ncbi:MAG TPA: TIGR03790 family protein [Tepidisphaeraceae bacterium]|jgi:uncharacterized protein (TIGR03790 family)
MPRRVATFVLALLTLCAAAPTRALEPDNLLLIVNKSVPEGRTLAGYYADKRKVPANRIVELDLPPAEEITFDDYEIKVVPVVRDFIARNNLADRVTCLVPFYGVPLKVAARTNTPADQVEIVQLRKDLVQATSDAESVVRLVETMAREVDPKFSPGTDASLAGLTARDAAARGVIGRYAMSLNDPQQFEAVMERAEKLVSPLVGSAPTMQRRVRELARFASRWTPEQKKESETLRARLLEFRRQLDALEVRRNDPAAREQIRNLVKREMGLVEYARLLEGMIGYLYADSSDAALDSELALVQWNFYPRTRWIANPLHYRHPRRDDLPPVMMTMRLDGPQAGTVRDIILGSLKAETEGLEGKVVVDAGGSLAIDAKNPNYVSFDQRLKNLARIVRTQTSLPLVLDENREVLPAHSVKDSTAIYCGWYSLQNYVPACTFAPGAVGFHVASFEMTTLRTQNVNQWVRGMLNDGIAATLGATNEPFLTAFPPPDEFFPLLFTGKLTLAEVYWRTVPFASWRVAAIGDPLYRPYQARPAMRSESLSKPLQAALKPILPPASAPVR